METEKSVMMPDEREVLAEMVEVAVDEFCERYGVDPMDAERLAAVYAGTLVHAIWSLVGLGVSAETMHAIAKDVISDACVAIEIEQFTSAPMGHA